MVMVVVVVVSICVFFVPVIVGAVLCLVFVSAGSQALVCSFVFRGEGIFIMALGSNGAWAPARAAYAVGAGGGELL